MKETRLQRAKEKQSWSLEDWIKVIFSDESVFAKMMMLELFSGAVLIKHIKMMPKKNQ